MIDNPKIEVDGVEFLLNQCTLAPANGEELIVLEVPTESRHSVPDFPLFIELDGRRFQKYFAYYYLKPGLTEGDLAVMWDYLAKDYDQHVNLTLNTEIYKIFQREIKNRVNGELDSILDYGVGTGKFLMNVFGQSTAELMGADVSKEMCKLSEQKGIDTRIITESKTEFPDSCTAAIIACFVIHLFGSDTEPYKEWYRLLRQGGVIVFNHRNPEIVAKEFFGKDDFKTLYQEFLREIGFKEIKTWPEKIDLGQGEFKKFWFTAAIK